MFLTFAIWLFNGTMEFCDAISIQLMPQNERKYENRAGAIRNFARVTKQLLIQQTISQTNLQYDELDFMVMVNFIHYPTFNVFTVCVSVMLYYETRRTCPINQIF